MRRHTWMMGAALVGGLGFAGTLLSTSAMAQAPAASTTAVQTTVTTKTQTQPVAPVIASMQIHKVVSASGKESLQATEKVQLDDTVQYTMEYLNTTKSPISNFRATFDIPKGMTFVSPLASQQPTQALDADGKWRPYPLTWQDPNSRRTEPAPGSHYKAFAWVVPQLEPGKAIQVMVRTKLTQAPQ